MITAMEAFYQKGMVQLQGEGRLSLAQLTDMLAAAIFRADAPLRILCDVRRMDIDADVFALFDQPDEVARAGITRQDRFAVLCSPMDRGFLAMEGSALEHGYQVRVFTGKAAAIAWLRSDANREPAPLDDGVQAPSEAATDSSVCLL